MTPAHLDGQRPADGRPQAHVGNFRDGWLADLRWFESSNIAGCRRQRLAGVQKDRPGIVRMDFLGGIIARDDPAAILLLREVHDPSFTRPRRPRHVIAGRDVVASRKLADRLRRRSEENSALLRGRPPPRRADLGYVSDEDFHRSVVRLGHDILRTWLNKAGQRGRGRTGGDERQQGASKPHGERLARPFATTNGDGQLGSWTREESAKGRQQKSARRPKPDVRRVGWKADLSNAPDGWVAPDGW